MGLLDFEYLNEPVRWIRNREASASGRGQLKSVVARRPEVMVKITGCSKSYGHAGNSLQYISREGKLTLETDRGIELKGKSDVAELGQEWLIDDVVSKKGRQPRANQRVATSMVFSMPEGTNAEKVKKAARELAIKEFGGKHRYAFALHTDAKHPHVHLVIQNCGLSGQRGLHFSRERLQELRESFAKTLERQGIEAVASPRQVRGKTQKSEKTAYFRVKERLHAKGERTTVEVARMKEAHEEHVGIRIRKPRPWEARINATQKAVRKAWLDHANQSADKAYAVKVVDFVRSMPVQKSRRQELDTAISAALERRQRDQDKNYNNKKDKPDERNL